MTITKMYQIIMIFFLTYKRSLAQSANSQQPTANSQQPTANSQQPTSNFYSNKFIYIHFCKQEQSLNLKCFLASFCGCSFFMLCNCKLPHGLLRSFLIGKTSFVCVTNSPWFGKSTIFQTWKERMNYKCLSMFFLFGVKGVFLFLITKKRATPQNLVVSWATKTFWGGLIRNID